MIRQTHSARREEIVARAVAPVVAELRLVEAADFVAFIRLEQRAALADIVASAAELFLMPGALRLGPGSEADLAWGAEPRITLALELWLRGATVHFRLLMDADRAGLEIGYVSFAAPGANAEEDTVFLAGAVNEACLRPAEQAAAR